MATPYLGETGLSALLGLIKTALSGKANSSHTHGSITDYGDTSKQIQIGYAGAGLTESNANYVAGYTESGSKIKDLSFSVLASILSNTSKVSNNALAKKSDISTNADTVDSKHVWVGSTLPSTRDSNTIYFVI